MPKQNPHRGSTLDDLLEQEGTLGEFQAQAIKEVIAWQLAEAMKDRKTRIRPSDAGEFNQTNSSEMIADVASSS